jgi:hypothetical protein
MPICLFDITHSPTGISKNRSEQLKGEAVNSSSMSARLRSGIRLQADTPSLQGHGRTEKRSRTKVR